MAEQHVADAVLVARRQGNLRLRAGPGVVDRLDGDAAAGRNDVQLGVEQRLQRLATVDLAGHHGGSRGSRRRDRIHGGEHTTGDRAEQHVTDLNSATGRSDDLGDGDGDRVADDIRQCLRNNVGTGAGVSGWRHRHGRCDGQQVLAVYRGDHVEHVAAAGEDIRRRPVGDVLCDLELTRCERDRVLGAHVGDVVVPVDLRVQVQHGCLDVELEHLLLTGAPLDCIDTNTIALGGTRADGQIRVVEPDEILGRPNSEVRGVRRLDDAAVETILHTNCKAQAVGLFNRELRPRCFVRPGHSSPPT